MTQVKTLATDGYDAVQVGYRRVRDKKLTKPELGHLEKSGSVDGFEVGKNLAVDELFEEGDLVDVSGTPLVKAFKIMMMGLVCELQICIWMLKLKVESRSTTSREV